MTKENIQAAIHSLSDSEKLSFFVDGEKARNRFDHNQEKKESHSTDHVSNRAFLLFKWIYVAVFAKAKGPSKAREVLPLYDHLFSSLTKDRQSKEAARAALNKFVLGTENITNKRLCTALSFFALAKEEDVYPTEKEEIERLFSRKKDVLFNQVDLFVQALFRCFLLGGEVSPDNILIDKGDLCSGIVYYHHKRIIPTLSGNYSLSAFQEEAEKGIDRASDQFPLEEVKTVMVFYPSVGLSVSCPVEE